MSSWYDKLATGEAPFAPLTNPAYWVTGGGSPSQIQDPNRLPRRGAGAVSPSNRPQTRTDAPYATQRTPTPGETREQHDAYNKANFPNAGVGTWSGEPGTGAPGGQTKNQMTGLRPPAPAFGSQSGPGILENWFNQRATGTDPAFEYATRRGLEQLGNRYSAAGAFNSGAARQGESDFYANLVSQRQGQLDALAAGASGEHRGRLNDMFNQGLGLAGGQAGVGGAYDITSANTNNSLMNALIQLLGNKAGVDNQSNQQGISNIASLYALGA